ncbi:MAG: DUF1566 domain-containing protein [Chitinophagales bacterium]
MGIPFYLFLTCQIPSLIQKLVNGTFFNLLIIFIMKYKIGDLAHGGIVFYVDETGEHGKVVTPNDYVYESELFSMDFDDGDDTFLWEDAKELCAKLREGGFDDWRLPSREELNLIYTNLYKAGLGNLTDYIYWSSETSYIMNGDYGWYQDFEDGKQNYFHRAIAHVRAVRVF